MNSQTSSATFKVKSQQNQRLFYAYNYYRFALSCIFLLTFISHVADEFFGVLHPSLFNVLSTTYLIFSILILARYSLGQPWTQDDSKTLPLIIIDILIIDLLMYSSGGVSCGLGNLIIFCVATGSIIISGRLSILLAAIASIAIIGAEFYLFAVEPHMPSNFVQAGLLGALSFVICISMQNLVIRIRLNEALARKREKDIIDLETLNKLIIQRMRTGIIVVNAKNEIITVNESATRLLINPEGMHPTPHTKLIEPLAQRLTQWKQDKTLRTSIFRPYQTGPELQASFTSLQHGENSNVLIFLEDNIQISQKAQQLKLASLGRLTASIAHEIRNPLGAISHASQLLKESPELDKADHRLTEIIEEHCGRVNGIIENILLLSRHKASMLEKLLLKPWLEDFVLRFKSSFEPDADIHIKISPITTEIRVNPSQFEQILVNLCQNGLRYSKENTGKASLILQGGINETNERPYLNVIDQGVGIAETEIYKIFEPFYTTDVKGTGLGLYICKELCAANQAHLDYIVQETQGSCFRISLAHPELNVI